MVWTSPESGQHVGTCRPDFLIWTGVYLNLDWIWTKSGPNLDQIWTKSGPNLESSKNRLDQFRQPPNQSDKTGLICWGVHAVELLLTADHRERAQEIKWKNTELTTSWNITKIYLMLHNMREANPTLCVLCLFSVCFSKCNSCVGLVCCWRGNLDLLKWADFWSCWLNHEKRLKSWKKIEILKSWDPT
jgi:hypothetical protein